MRLSDENLRGRTVIAADGQAIGEIVALFLDSDAWRVESLQVKLRNEVADQLGATRGMFHAGTLEMPIRMVQSVGDAVVLSVPHMSCDRFCRVWATLRRHPNDGGYRLPAGTRPCNLHWVRKLSGGITPAAHHRSSTVPRMPNPARRRGRSPP